MDTDIPMPADVDPDAKRRSDDIQKSVELGQKRSEAERELHERLRMQKEAEDAQSHRAVQERMQAKQESQKKMKGFRSVLKNREKEYEEFEKRKQAEKQWYERQNEQVRARRTKEKAYMTSLNASSTEIIAERRRVEALKAEEARAEQKIEFDHATSIQEVERLERQTIERITSDARQKTASLEEKARQELYKLEGWKRAQMSALDAETHRLQASLQYLSPMDASRELQRTTVQLRTKKRAINKDFTEKRSAIDASHQREKLALDRDKTEALFHAGLDARHEITKADRLRDSRLEETRHEYDRRIRDRSQGVKKQGS